MATRSMLDVPPAGTAAAFAPDFGQRVLLTVDTEEEFDWKAPFRRDGYGLSHVAAIARFQSFCENIGARPVYLVDWPIVNDDRAVEIIGDAVRRGTAEVGLQLHPWVNPPFDEELCVQNSFAGNLPRDLEAAKFMALRDAIEAAFGAAPLCYRAGRYGLGPHTADLLKSAGIRLDTSVRTLFDYSAQGGPDYSRHPLLPYWVDDDQELLELPVTSVYWGALRRFGPFLHRAQRHVPTFFSGFSRFNLLERIALTPEGVTPEEALRGIEIALGAGVPVLVLSFHSPTLAHGHTPYTATPQAVERLYDWFSAIYAELAQRGVQSTTVEEIIAASDK
ncbi:polysaccharide deacetylase family protein [Porphyrobacter sp. AAP60]|uniref:polysaccharide deacetylase family protein n=1 Tax=Porphyrobacter sp. AAP60 TaxID=1523423 RepID=UPI0006B9EE9D|nr:polysaccharide deacetylase family protein [Porphyrobacter sp. AAP60]KPF64877.1 WalW protein [Porphyrobacter sp. AAP60]